MRVLLLTYGSRGAVEQMVGFAVELRALGTRLQVCVTPDCAAAEGCDALVATGVVLATKC